MSQQTTDKSLKPKPIIVWCHTRSCSTTLVRAFSQHPDVKVSQDPFIQTITASHIDNVDVHQTREPSPWQNVKRIDIANMFSENRLPILDDETQTIVEGPYDRKIVLVKDMAQCAFRGEALVSIRADLNNFRAPKGSTPYVVPDPIDATPENPTVFPVSLLRKFTHVFLVREPERTIPSVVNGVHQLESESSEGMGVQRDPSGYIMYREQRILYNFFADPKSEFNALSGDDEYDGYIKQPQLPPLIDVSDLLRDPPSVLEQLCSAIGLEYTPSILQWSNDKPSKEFDLPWRALYKHAEESTGFDEDNRTHEEILNGVSPQRRELVQSLIQRWRPDYEVSAVVSPLLVLRLTIF
ncbi:hypothetical protein SISNIDRAFT_547812 [Sistotremastrum niveocremeum HHB9708]|uniref:P-loop containing nucleoside triphosphate hydrolase protein n=2 Tax=Sistotremastraceae TaxID=3402574 RepID=A0A164XXH2_9AGAM|nr:hypothetical protein SISNIDRAFT_547812 [Sistotremastrum niveocremeum HHB9708]KZT35337.1 hypothetical protein SISSUDRAFT_1131194 [Sistotremastrum suecicum HHB10207 ss-3]